MARSSDYINAELRALSIPDLIERLVSTYVFVGSTSARGELKTSTGFSNTGELIQRILLEKVMELIPLADESESRGSTGGSTRRANPARLT